MNWIDVKDRLPEDDHYVLINNLEGRSHMCAPQIWIASYNTYKKKEPPADWLKRMSHKEAFDLYNMKDGWEFIGDISLGEVTHWMPLPQPPKDKE